MNKTEARKWIKRAREDLRIVDADINTKGTGWETSGDTYESVGDAIGSLAAIQLAIEKSVTATGRTL